MQPRSRARRESKGQLFLGENTDPTPFLSFFPHIFKPEAQNSCIIYLPYATADHA